MCKAPSTSEQAAEWEALVGKAMLRFGDIELVSIKCLDFVPTDKISDSAATLSFGRRTSLLIEILEARNDLDEDSEAILNGIRRAKTLSKIRNLIAHNPVMLDLYVNEDETESFAEHSIRSARSGVASLDLAALQEFAAEVDELSSTLWKHFLYLAKGEESIWREHEI